ncbi:MAG: BamA/TamA family outer membrane protein, partial [Dongiaceae bacterium]
GGDSQYIKPELGAGYYYPLGENTVVSLLGNVGLVEGIGKNVLITDRYFLGGSSFRGFRIAGIGPRDRSTEDALGGKYYAKGTTEITFPLGLPAELGILGSLFSDFGTLTGLDEEDANVEDTGKIRVSVGAGLSWRSPFGPIRIDMAVPLIEEEGDKREFFQFNFGTRF